MIFKLELTQQQMDVVSQALGEMPCKIVFATIVEIQRQITAQQVKPEAPIEDGQ